MKNYSLLRNEYTIADRKGEKRKITVCKKYRTIAVFFVFPDRHILRRLSRHLLLILQKPETIKQCIRKQDHMKRSVKRHRA